MKISIARKYEPAFEENSFDPDESIAVQKDQDWENETTWWIFEDGSALGLDSYRIIKIRDNYGLHRDHEQLKR